MTIERAFFDGNFRELFSKLPGLYLILLRDFTIVAASEAYLAVAKMSREQLVQKKFFDIFPDNPKLRASVEKVLSKRITDVVAAQEYKIDGQTKLWTSISTPVLDSAGEVTYIIRQVEDVTESVRHENEQKTIEQERDLFFTHSFDILAVVGSDGYFKRFNPALCRALGHTEEELYSKPLAHYIHPDDVSKTRKGIEILSEGTTRIASKNRYRCKDGSYKWFSWNTIPMGNSFFTVGRDITKQIASEESIRQLNFELERRNEDLEKKIQGRVNELRKSEAQMQHLQKMDAIGTLAGGVAHDFNNILGAIQMYCEIIDDEAEDTQQVRTCIEQVQLASNRGASLTRQLLLFSRQQVQQLQSILLNDLIKDHFKMLNRLIREDIKIVTKLAANLPIIQGDYGQIEQVIMNLVINARDAMPSGGEITIETSYLHLHEEFTSANLTVSSGLCVLLSVMDTGIGMDEKTRSKIFEPFFTTKPIGKGTGLGLSTVYGIVKASEGSIRVYSELGKGSVFKIYFPASHDILSVPEPTEKKVTDFKGHETILLVEDEEELRILFERILVKQGYKILKANNGQEAMELINSYQGTIDLLITDVIMPSMGGIELVEKALKIKPNLKILYMSGYTNETIGIQIENAKNQSFIQKPFTGQMLMGKVRELLPMESKGLIQN